MSVSEKSYSSTTSSSLSFYGAREVDPLLKDLSEKKLNFRRNVVCLAAELKDVRSRLASKEQSFANETLTRREAEAKAKKMEDEMYRLKKSLEEKNVQFHSSASSIAEKCVKDLDDLRSELSTTRATVDASAASAQLAHLQCLSLVKELHEKSGSLKEHEDRVNSLEEQLEHLHNDLKARESSQNQLKDEVMRTEHEIVQAVGKAGAAKDCELMRLLDEVSLKNLENMNRLLIDKDNEIVKLKDEIRFMSAHWKLKTEDLESQLVKHQKADQELKKRVLKLEFCLHEARAQTRKLQRMGERRDKALKELRDQLEAKSKDESPSAEKENFWESSGFKFVASMSMLILVVFSKR